MALTAASIVFSVALAANPGLELPSAGAPAAGPVGIAAALNAPSSPDAPAMSLAKPPAVEAWMIDGPQRRPASLPLLYGTLGALNAFDVYSTRRAIRAGAVEANPLMRNASGNAGALLAAKAASTAAAIYFAERAWKKNKKGTVIVMAIVNGVTAAIVANNLRSAR